jgi:hypothetical protein
MVGAVRGGVVINGDVVSAMACDLTDPRKVVLPTAVLLSDGESPA